MSVSGSELEVQPGTPVKFHIEWSHQFDVNSGTVYSPVRVIGNLTWFLALEPQLNVLYENGGKEHCVGFFLCHRSKAGSAEHPIQVSGKLGLDDGKGGVSLELDCCKPVLLDYTITPRTWDAYAFQRTSYSIPCLLHHSHASGRNPLTIRAEIEYLENPAKPTLGLHLQQDLALLQESFRDSYESGTCCDFVLVSSDGVEKAVHRAILIARSPVFAAMLQSNLKECQTGRCIIKDVKSSVLTVLVQYMYCACLESDIDKETEDIFVAADKYQLTNLVKQCEQHLIKKLTADNIVDLLYLTDGINAPSLKSAALKFIRANSAALKCSGAIKKLCEKASPELFVEVLTFFLPA